MIKADYFAKELRNIAPNKENLVKLGFDDDFLQMYLRSYELKSNGRESVTDNPILDLIFRYEIDYLNISLMSFNQVDDVIETPKFIIFGALDSDLLAIKKDSKEVVVLDWEEKDSIISYASDNSYSFLECLLKLANFNKLMLLDEELSDNQEAIFEEAKKITEIGGGEKYFHFFLNALGYEG